MLYCYSAVLNHKKASNKILFLLREIWDPEELPFFQAPGVMYNMTSFTFDLLVGDSDLPHVTSVREVVIARAHVTVIPRLRDAETRRVTGSRCIVQQRINFPASVTPCVEVQVQLLSVKFIYVINHFKRQAGASRGLE